MARKGGNAMRTTLAVLAASLVITGLWGLTGCALVAPSKIYDNETHIVSGAAESATVHFLRSCDLDGLWVAVRVDLDGESLLRMRSGTYATLAIKPGSYTMVIDSPRPRGTDFYETVSFSAGETYHVLVYTGPFYGYVKQIRFKIIKPEHAERLMEEEVAISIE